MFDHGERWRGGPDHQIRAVLATAEHTAVGYRLPVLELLRTEDEEQVVGHLGPDLLGPDWDPETALRNLLADPGRRVGDALLDQRNLAGVGNVYMCELCFMARATPWLPVGELSLPLATRLVSTAKQLLDANRDRPVRTTTAATPAMSRRLPGNVSSSTEGSDAPVCGVAPRSARPSATTAPPTGAHAVSPVPPAEAPYPSVTHATSVPCRCPYALSASGRCPYARPS